MIISAACRAVVNGEENIFPVHRHADFFLWMKFLHCKYDKEKVEQGFIDWNELEKRGEFVSREEAFKRAQWANQIPKWKEPTELFSEDLW